MTKIFTDGELHVAGLAATLLNEKLLKQKNEIEKHIKMGGHTEDYPKQLKLIDEQIEDIKTLILKLLQGPETSVIYL